MTVRHLTAPLVGLSLVLIPTALGLALSRPASGADLPRHRHAARLPRQRLPPPPGAFGAEAVVPAVPLAPVTIGPPPPSPLVFMPVLPDPVLAPRRGGCRPGYMVDADGVCRRSGELLVSCDPYGREPCRPLPPTPIPYGIGPYLRLDY